MDKPFYENNIDYKLMATFDGKKLYVPVDEKVGYNTQRFVSIQRQSLFASSGTTPELLSSTLDEIIKNCNEQGEVGTRFTDIGLLANMLKYRLQHPIDEHCSLRVGMLCTFLEYKEGDVWYSEPKGAPHPVFEDIKFEMAMQNPDVYDFFLGLGVYSTPSYRNHWHILEEEEDYWRKRKEVLENFSKRI